MVTMTNNKLKRNKKNGQRGARSKGLSLDLMALLKDKGKDLNKNNDHTFDESPEISDDS